jgi:hypothetical protein
MVPQVRTTPRDPANLLRRLTAMTIAHDAHPSTDDHDDTVEAHYASLERPHACTDGVVYIGHLVEDPGTGEEVEVVEAMQCRQCAEEAR